jgi:hypothetical protein
MAWVELVLASEPLTTVPEQPKAPATTDTAAIPV